MNLEKKEETSDKQENVDLNLVISSESDSSDTNDDSSDDSYSSSSSDECEEDDGIGVSGEEAACFFCTRRENDPDLVMAHMRNKHGFNISMLKAKYGMDQESYVKMVNWLRSLKFDTNTTTLCTEVNRLAMMGLRRILFEPPPLTKKQPIQPKIPPWNDQQWYTPTWKDDMMHTYFIVDPECEGEDCESINDRVLRSRRRRPRTRVEEVENPRAPQQRLLKPASLSIKHLFMNEKEYKKHKRHTFKLMKMQFSSLQNSKIRRLTAQVKYLEDSRQKLIEVVQRIVDHDQIKNVIKYPYEETKTITVNKYEKEESYFDSYDEMGIHADMLKDMPRTMAYYNAILQNRDNFSGKHVLDLGTGTGILSLFSADAGAAKVYAVDVSSMIYDAMSIVFDNDKEKVIQFFHEKLENIKEEDLPKVDVLVSEFMGYFLLFEGMTNSFLLARDRFLKPGGAMYPNTAKMFLVAVSDEEAYKDDVLRWDKFLDMYKMNTLKTRVLKEAHVMNIPPGNLASEEVVIKDLDLTTATPNDLIIDQTFAFSITKTCNLTAVCGYFNVGFPNSGELKTGPEFPSTHWKQVIFYLPKPKPVDQGHSLDFEFSCKPHPEFERWLEIKLKFQGEKCNTYDLK